MQRFTKILLSGLQRALVAAAVLWVSGAPGAMAQSTLGGFNLPEVTLPDLGIQDLGIPGLEPSPTGFMRPEDAAAAALESFNASIADAQCQDAGRSEFTYARRPTMTFDAGEIRYRFIERKLRRYGAATGPGPEGASITLSADLADLALDPAVAPSPDGDCSLVEVYCQPGARDCITTAQWRQGQLSEEFRNFAVIPLPSAEDVAAFRRLVIAAKAYAESGATAE